MVGRSCESTRNVDLWTALATARNCDAQIIHVQFTVYPCMARACDGRSFNTMLQVCAFGHPHLTGDWRSLKAPLYTRIYNVK